jgi:hypothetical protein
MQLTRAVAVCVPRVADPCFEGTVCRCGVKFIRSRELCCWEVKLFSYNKERAGLGPAESCCVLLLSVHLVALPWPLHDYTTLNTRLFTVRKTPLTTQTKVDIHRHGNFLFWLRTSVPGKALFEHSAAPFLFGSSENMIAERSAGSTQGNMKSVRSFGWRTSVQ